ncbi:pentatricopeptide repeat-containing protein At1g26460, mitochondrial [Camellia sinensis]|uniref:pentatricopeptide repeat-containing protein At1g26460, mitochondrial n=1 Tax=Camellia sinensis TaxID=4442 RepID=UPI001036D80F|nr:pentatricopeptide repeat-containing protein At1g26460, mitochondrial [Camellia sinensis]XP_028057813.1 pentatricopeptide repeat-containing protein At1g26460, mitochondrial [Camellia sinensis]XP_028057815.1 pentatricopeptide repeat-containing protein At1g26460, mitochondrial [Camellia sinensis]XP_028057816.1 pentatricopeptide repeat-containing protein At1g26460, mitochondrial [Camellia sinensis]
MASMAILTRSRTFLKSINHDSFKSITTFAFLSQEPQLAEAPPAPAPPSAAATPLPPNPASGSPLYNENWRNPIASSTGLAQSLIPLGFLNQTQSTRIQALSQTLDVPSLLNVFADWMTSQRWADMKQLFEFWIRSLDKNGKPNKPDVNLYNQYLRANVMMGASAGELLDLVAQMEDYSITPNTASFNLVLKAMYQARETEAAEKLLERMLQTGKESLPDDESYDLVIGMLLLTDQIDAALKYIDLTLKSGYILSVNVFTECVRSCVNKGRLDTLVSIIERCKKMDQNKALCPPWNLCNYIADVAMEEDSSELAYYALEFMAKWIARGENARPPVLLSVDEGLVVSALGTAGRTYNAKLLDGSWAILKRSLRQKKVPNPESYLAKIYAHASLGNLQKAFSTLHEFETACGNSTKEAEEDLLSPFTSLYPLVMACSKDGFVTLDSVYYQLENLSQADPPYKSVAALNCIILGCANTWDVDRAYQTFEAIGGAFGLIPNIHSYNALMCAFVKLNKTSEASSVFDHLISKGVKPNSTTYSLLVNAHLIKRDQKAALSVINEMVNSGFEPSREMLKKVRRRCIREMDYESDDQVESLARKYKIGMGFENRRDLLFNLEYSTAYT